MRWVKVWRKLEEESNHEGMKRLQKDNKPHVSGDSTPSLLPGTGIHLEKVCEALNFSSSGSVPLLEASRKTFCGGWRMSRIKDLRFAGRVLVRDKGFTATAILTLSICIGANAALFSIVNSVILSPLPVPESERIVLMYNSYPNAGVERAANGVPDYYDRLRDLEDVFEEQALYTGMGVTVGEEGSPQRLQSLERQRQVRAPFVARQRMDFVNNDCLNAAQLFSNEKSTYQVSSRSE